MRPPPPSLPLPRRIEPGAARFGWVGGSGEPGAPPPQPRVGPAPFALLSCPPPGLVLGQILSGGPGNAGGGAPWSASTRVRGHERGRGAGEGEPGPQTAPPGWAEAGRGRPVSSRTFSILLWFPLLRVSRLSPSLPLSLSPSVPHSVPSSRLCSLSPVSSPCLHVFVSPRDVAPPSLSPSVPPTPPPRLFP